MNTCELLKDLFRQMEWADALVWSVVLKHPALVADASLRERLYHLHLVQRAFLHVWRGEALAFNGTDTLTGKDLAVWGRTYHASVHSFMKSVTDSQLDGAVNLPWASQVMEHLGTSIGAPSLADTLVQVPTHSTSHRGQVNARIRELGQAPPLTDFIAWVWSNRPEPAWPKETE